MVAGMCPHCGSHGQRYFEADKRAKHQALHCLTCGHITAYYGFDGTRQDALPYVMDCKLDVTAVPATYGHPTERVRV